MHRIHLVLAMIDKKIKGVIKSDETLFLIIDEIHENGPIGVSEIASNLNMGKSRVHKHLKTLHTHNWVYNNNGQYSIGMKFLKYGGKIRDNDILYRSGRDLIDDLAKELDEFVILSKLEFNKGVFLYYANDQFNLKRSIPIGTRFHLHQNAAGKAMLAELPQNQINNIVSNNLPRSTEFTLTNKNEIHAEVLTIRENGFAKNVGERDKNLSAISAAVGGSEFGMIGAISISFPHGMLELDFVKKEYVEPLQRQAKRLTLALANEL